jgi:hypothetical protein
MKNFRAVTKWMTLAGLIVIMTSCGGGGGGGGVTTPPPPPPPPAVLTVTTSNLPTASQGAAYSQKLSATGGIAPYSWSTSYGSPPPGIALSADGTISGTSTYTGQLNYFNLIVQVKDSAGTTASSNWISFPAVGTLTLPSNSLLAGNIGLNYFSYMNPSGGTPPFQISLAAGAALPNGLAWNIDHLSGMPTQYGTFLVKFQIQDSGTPAQTYTGDVSLVINNNLYVTNNNNLPVGVQNIAYLGSLTAVGGTLPYTWSLASDSGPLPSGLMLNPNGSITGMTSATGGFPFHVQLVDSSQPPQTTSAYTGLYINPTVFLGDNTLFDGIQNQNYYGGGVYAQYGRPPYTITLQSGALPPGLSFQTMDQGNLFIVGSPTATGTFTFTMKAIDSLQPPGTSTGTFILHVYPQLVISPVTLPPGLVGQPYSYQFVATGGKPPYSWNVGLRPNGLNLNSATGLFSGTPTAPYDGLVYMYVTDSATPSQQVALGPAIHVPDVLKINTSVLPGLSTNATTNLQLNSSGGTAPFTWAVTSGALPTGLSITQTGLISGTATTNGTYPFALTLSDGGPPTQTATVNYSVKVGAIGRNDSIATATPISNGTFNASISPAVDPVSGLLSPDVDYYKLTASPGSSVQVDISAYRQTPSSPLDSVLEFVDANGARLQYCSDGYGANYNQPCMNDDFPGAEKDSRLYLQFPATLTGPQTFYMKVLDWRGAARPDFFYQMIISGVN